MGENILIDRCRPDFASEGTIGVVESIFVLSGFTTMPIPECRGQVRRGGARSRRKSEDRRARRGGRGQHRPGGGHGARRGGHEHARPEFQRRGRARFRDACTRPVDPVHCCPSGTTGRIKLLRRQSSQARSISSRMYF